MKQDGYSEEYRRGVLKAALDRYDGKLAADESGERPLNRPPGYQREARRKAKKARRRNWASRGGYVAPVIVPCTPNSVLARRMRAANPETDPKLRLRVVERGGRPVGRMLMGNTNPTKSRHCSRVNCGVCKPTQPAGGGDGGVDGGQERGLPCSVSNITYKYVCQATPVQNEGEDTSNQNVDGQDTPVLRKCGATYFGETSKNMYTRDSCGSGSHRKLYQKGSAKSFLKNHQDLRHNGEPENFKCVVLQKFKDPLTRQVAESLNIAENMNVVELCNSKAEYHQPQIVRVSRQVQRGL